MPKMCFSYPADLPAPSGPRRMPNTACFSYSADLRRMPWSCFSYSLDVAPGTGNGNAAPSAPPGLRRMPITLCFRY